MTRRIIIALGGNAIQNQGGKGTYDEQRRSVHRAMRFILPLVTDTRYQTVITHGNGPQVGRLLALDKLNSSASVMPVFIGDAMSQGQLGYLIQQSLKNLLITSGCHREVVSLVTQVVVSKNDPAFKNPCKPIGPFYSQSRACQLAARSGFPFREDAGRGYRRVVPSPRPRRLVEIAVIEKLVRNDIIAIVGGGGGIPVIWGRGGYRGAEAVVDKDQTSALLADSLDARWLVILTAVPLVYLNFGSQNAVGLRRLTVAQARKYLKEKQFAAGSMRPKIEAAISFVQGKKERQVLITQPSHLRRAWQGQDGTLMVSD